MQRCRLRGSDRCRSFLVAVHKIEMFFWVILFLRGNLRGGLVGARSGMAANEELLLRRSIDGSCCTAEGAWVPLYGEVGGPWAE